MSHINDHVGRATGEQDLDVVRCAKAKCHRTATWIMEGDGEAFEFCDRHAQEAQIEHGYECVGTMPSTPESDSTASATHEKLRPDAPKET